MSGRVREGACVQEEPTASLDDLCDVVEAGGVAHSATSVKDQLLLLRRDDCFTTVTVANPLIAYMPIFLLSVG